MHRSSQRLTGLIATVALAASLALAVAPDAFADDWARERADVVAPVAVGDDWARDRRAVEQLDPAIRTAIVSRVPGIPATSPAAAAVPANDGFAWGAALLGLGAGVAGMCVLLGCVTLVRHDGRLRSA